MKLTLKPLYLAGVVLAAGPCLAADEAASTPAPSAEPTGAEPGATLLPHKMAKDEPAARATPKAKSDRNAAKVLAQLRLKDPELMGRTEAVLKSHFAALETWQGENKDELDKLWRNWSVARGGEIKDEVRAAEIAGQIREVYAGFQPQHAAFLEQLGEIMNPEQIELVKNVMTFSPGMERTYKTYLEIVPDLTGEQKAFIAEELKVAREEAMDGFMDREKANIFKTHKVKIEAYLIEQGYDWRALYGQYVEKKRRRTRPGIRAKTVEKTGKSHKEPAPALAPADKAQE